MVVNWHGVRLSIGFSLQIRLKVQLVLLGREFATMARPFKVSAGFQLFSFSMMRSPFQSGVWMFISWKLNSTVSWTEAKAGLCHSLHFSEIRVVVREKNGIMWEKFPSGGPPPPTPPVWEFSHFFTVFVKLVMPFYKLLNWKKQWKIWSGFGSDPPPKFGNFSHIIPFFFWERP